MYIYCKITYLGLKRFSKKGGKKTSKEEGKHDVFKEK